MQILAINNFGKWGAHPHPIFLGMFPSPDLILSTYRSSKLLYTKTDMYVLPLAVFNSWYFSIFQSRLSWMIPALSPPPPPFITWISKLDQWHKYLSYYCIRNLTQCICPMLSWHHVYHLSETMMKCLPMIKQIETWNLNIYSVCLQQFVVYI